MENKKTAPANYALLLKTIDDPRMRYMTAKKLAEIWPEHNFAVWKMKLEDGKPVVLMRASRRAELLGLKSKLEQIQAPVDIVEQKSIGGKPVF